MSNTKLSLALRNRLQPFGSQFRDWRDQKCFETRAPFRWKQIIECSVSHQSSLLKHISQTCTYEPPTSDQKKIGPDLITASHEIHVHGCEFAPRIPFLSSRLSNHVRAKIMSLYYSRLFYGDIDKLLSGPQRVTLNKHEHCSKTRRATSLLPSFHGIITSHFDPS